MPAPDLLGQALQFRVAMSQPIGAFSPENLNLQRDLIVEEFKEFLDAENQLIMGLTVNSADCLKELADLVYVCYQYAANLGWDLDEALDRVHKSNMTKLGEDGKPIYREDGKVLKGPNFSPPNIEQFLTAGQGQLEIPFDEEV